MARHLRSERGVLTPAIVIEGRCRRNSRRHVGLGRARLEAIRVHGVDDFKSGQEMGRQAAELLGGKGTVAFDGSVRTIWGGGSTA
jgi:hypothetical protein